MRAIFLDRDGVICENRSDHVKGWDEFRFLPRARNSLAALSRLGLPIIVVTNQSVVGRGIVPAYVMDDIHCRMVKEVETFGGRIDRVLYCPHRPEDLCDCRKPKPGMLMQAAREMNIDLSHSYLIGDATTDLVAGQLVGCELFHVLTGRGLQQLASSLRALDNFTITYDLMEATRRIVGAEISVPDESTVWSFPRFGQRRESLSAAHSS